MQNIKEFQIAANAADTIWEHQMTRRYYSVPLTCKNTFFFKLIMKYGERKVISFYGISVCAVTFISSVFSVQCFLRYGLEANLCPFENICPEHRILCQTQFIEENIFF